MYSPSYTVLFALFAFATVAFAKPVPEVAALAVRETQGLAAILEIVVNLHAQILVYIGKSTSRFILSVTPTD